MQKELAGEAEVSEFTVVRAEGGMSIRPDTARKIAEALGISVADLMERPPVPLPEAPQGPGPADAKGPDPDIWGEDEDRPKPAMPGTAGHHHQVDIREDDQGTEVAYTRRSFLDLYREIRAGKIAEDEAVKRFQRLADEESKHSA
jgi:hypothetical protein